MASPDLLILQNILLSIKIRLTDSFLDSFLSALTSGRPTIMHREPKVSQTSARIENNSLTQSISGSATKGSTLRKNL